MTVSIVHDGPPYSRVGRLFRAGARTLGFVFVGLTAVSIVPAVVICCLGAIQILPSFRQQQPLDNWSEPVRHALLPVWIVSLVVLVVCAPVGRRLVRTNRRLVLFLRRFGHAEATRAVTVAADRIGGSWRMVTLDDAQIAAVSVKPSVKKWRTAADLIGEGLATVFAFGRAAILGVAGVAVAGLVVCGVMVFLAADGDPAARLDAVLRLLGEWGDGGVAGVFEFFVWTLGWCFIVLFGGIVLAVAGLVLLPGILFAYTTIDNGIKAADRSRAISVRSTEAIRRSRTLIRQAAAKVFGARLTVLTVDSAIWRETVTGFGTDCAIALIDVSYPTENVRWEINLLLRELRRPCVFVGERERVTALLDPASDDPDGRSTRELLDGQLVLAYTTDPAGTRRFTQALRAMFEHQ